MVEVHKTQTRSKNKQATRMTADTASAADGQLIQNPDTSKVFEYALRIRTSWHKTMERLIGKTHLGWLWP